jgi:hypothetical protein
MPHDEVCFKCIKEFIVPPENWQSEKFKKEKIENIDFCNNCDMYNLLSLLVLCLELLCLIKNPNHFIILIWFLSENMLQFV